MFKQFFILLILFLSFFKISHAQTEKGSFMVGGSIGYNHENFKGLYPYTYSTFNLSPKFGYFFVKNFVVGLSTNWNRDRFVFKNSGSPSGENIQQRSSIKIGPFARIYALASPQIGLYLGAGFSLGPGTERYKNTANPNFKEDIIKTFSTQLIFGPGISFFLNRNVGLESSIQYALNSDKLVSTTYQFTNSVPANQKSNTILFSLGFQIYLAKQ